MPNKATFTIKPIKELILGYSLNAKCSIDPFYGKDNPIPVTYSNDLNPENKTDFNMDALDFLRECSNDVADLVLFDPPYSPRQVSECYKSLDKTVNMQTTQASFWGNLKKEIARVTKKGGKVITCGWNSGGIGKSLGFEIVEILLVAHGGWHNDTIVTVEKKIR